MSEPSFDSYSHSGKTGAGALPAGLIGGVAGGIVLAWVYQLFIDWIPLVYFSFFATLIFGLALGYLMGSALHWGHCRNNALATALTVVVSLVAIAASYGCAYYRVASDLASKKSVPTSEVVQRLPLGKYLEIRVESGWKLGRGGGLPISGVFVYVVWALEALMILGGAVVTARSVIEKPYCEDCLKWSEEETLGRKSSVSPEVVSRAAAQGSIDELIAAPSDPAGTSALVYKLHACNDCLQLAYLTITREWSETNSKGEVEQKNETVASMVRVSQKQRDRLKDELKGAVPPGPIEEAQA